MTGEIVELFVLRNGDRWTVMADGIARGNFDYQVDAEEAAIRLARCAQAKGRPSGVMSPDGEARCAGSGQSRSVTFKGCPGSLSGERSLPADVVGQQICGLWESRDDDQGRG